MQLAPSKWNMIRSNSLLKRRHLTCYESDLTKIKLRNKWAKTLQFAFKIKLPHKETVASTWCHQRNQANWTCQAPKRQRVAFVSQPWLHQWSLTAPGARLISRSNNKRNLYSLPSQWAALMYWVTHRLESRLLPVKFHRQMFRGGCKPSNKCPKLLVVTKNKQMLLSFGSKILFLQRKAANHNLLK